MEATLNLNKEVMAETYEDVKMLIYKTVHGFIKRYGGDFDELMAEANYSFVRNTPKHDESKGPYIAYVKFSIWNDLLSLQRASRRHCHSELNDNTSSTVSPSRIPEIIEDLPSDAKFVALLVLEAPEELATMMLNEGGRPRGARRAIKQYLSNLGWTAEQVKRSFEEIGEAL
jgi:hypothetical protein